MLFGMVVFGKAVEVWEVRSGRVRWRESRFGRLRQFSFGTSWNGEVCPFMVWQLWRGTFSRVQVGFYGKAV